MVPADIPLVAVTHLQTLNFVRVSQVGSQGRIIKQIIETELIILILMLLSPIFICSSTLLVTSILCRVS